MSNSTYLLLSQPPREPDTLVVLGAFRGAGKPVKPSAYTVGAGTAAAGDYLELDLATATAPEAIALPAGAPGDRVAFLATNIGLGVTVTGTGLSYAFSESDHIVVFEYSGSAWVLA